MRISDVCDACLVPVKCLNSVHAWFMHIIHDSTLCYPCMKMQNLCTRNMP